MGALCCHVSVNAFNEYYDFRSGLDARTRRTPFSGGSGTLPGKPELAGQALATAVVTHLAVVAVAVVLAEWLLPASLDPPQWIYAI